MRHCSRALAGVLIAVTAIPLAYSQTCDQLKAEIANLLQTIANEQRSLADCNSHPGSCSTGQISGIRLAIETANAELEEDRAKLPTTCQGPPPSNVDHVKLEGVEVVQ